MFLSRDMLIIALANESALTLPWILIWFGSLLKILTINRFSNLVYLSDWRTEMESEWMINFLELHVEIKSSAKFIA